jgi:hypothetical protein
MIDDDDDDDDDDECGAVGGMRIGFWDVITSGLVGLRGPCFYHLQGGRWRKHVSSIHRQSPTRVNGVTFEKTVIFIVITMRNNQYPHRPSQAGILATRV